ncbi:Uncharacterised protein [Raoultella terrigena]|uniref:Uncharacterized protein n=1 Tax=Raoultella terrigena TaxID=577 RepID=A0A4U9D988_RAOTE|nr:Uncharacterised protein [Raoultella terrigena]
MVLRFTFTYEKNIYCHSPNIIFRAPGSFHFIRSAGAEKREAHGAAGRIFYAIKKHNIFPFVTLWRGKMLVKHILV